MCKRMFPLVPKVSAALWERRHEAELGFGGGRESMGAALRSWCAGGEAESRRNERAQSAALTLGTRRRTRGRNCSCRSSCARPSAGLGAGGSSASRCAGGSSSAGCGCSSFSSLTTSQPSPPWAISMPFCRRKCRGCVGAWREGGARFGGARRERHLKIRR